jgi:hypothetical protein
MLYKYLIKYTYNKKQLTEMMDETITNIPNTYEPKMNREGQFVDIIPSNISSGYICNCNIRKTTFYSRTAFNTHTKTKSHTSWLEQYNQNKASIIAENSELKEKVKQQQIIITEQSQQIFTMEQNLNIKDTLIHTLAKRISELEKNNTNKMHELDI